MILKIRSVLKEIQTFYENKIIAFNSWLKNHKILVYPICCVICAAFAVLVLYNLEMVSSRTQEDTKKISEESANTIPEYWKANYLSK